MKKFPASFYVLVFLLSVSCRKDETRTIPPEIVVNSSKSTPYGILIDFEVIDEDFEIVKVFVNNRLYRSYSVQNVHDTINGLTPWNRYTITIQALDEKDNLATRELNLFFAPPPLLILPQSFVFWSGENVTFAWNGVINATAYRIQLSRMYDFTTIDFDTIVHDTTFERPFTDSGYIYLRVASFKDTLMGDWSDVCAIRIANLTPPDLIFPINQTFWVYDTVRFSWYEKDGAEFYRFQLARDSIFSDVIFDTVLNNTSLTYPSNGGLGGFYWRVKAGRASMWTDWSRLGVFNIVIPSFPELLSPSDSSFFWNSEYVPFSWTSVSGAEGYILEISSNSSFTQIVSSPYTVSTFYNWTPGSNTGMLFCRVKARRGSNTTQPSNVVRIISINSTPNLISPSDGAGFWNAETLLFRWNSILLASNYRLQVSSDAGFNTVSLDIATPDTLYSWIPVDLNGSAFWRVRGEKSGVPGYFSNVRSIILYPYEAGEFLSYNNLGFDVQGNLVYLTRNVGSELAPVGALLVLNVSNPASPYVAGSYTSPSTWPKKFTDIFVKGDYAYVVDSIWGLRIFNVLYPQSINEEGFWQVYPSSTYSIFVQNQYAYLLVGSGSVTYLEVLSVSNPSNPVILGRIRIDGGRKVFVSGNYAFVARGSYGVSILDVSSPLTPRLISNVATSSEALDVFANMPFLYVATGSGGLIVIDVSNPSNPIIMGRYSNLNVGDVWVSNNAVYATGVNNLLTVIDVSDPSHLKELGRFRPQGKSGRWVKVGGNLAFVGNENGLKIFRIKTN
jgi:hypothetical protein